MNTDVSNSNELLDKAIVHRETSILDYKTSL